MYCIRGLSWQAGRMRSYSDPACGSRRLQLQKGLVHACVQLQLVARMTTCSRATLRGGEGGTGQRLTGYNWQAARQLASGKVQLESCVQLLLTVSTLATPPSLFLPLHSLQAWNFPRLNVAHLACQWLVSGSNWQTVDRQTV